MTLNGSEDWIKSMHSTDVYPCFVLQISEDLTAKSTYIISDKFKYSSEIGIKENNFEGINIAYKTIRINILSSKLADTNVESFKVWLSQNPITVQYELATESVKTVDLTCINEQGESVIFRPIEGTMHVSTSSQTLPPLLDMSVPVEATSQNLMSFANIVEEEK